MSKSSSLQGRKKYSKEGNNSQRPVFPGQPYLSRAVRHREVTSREPGEQLSSVTLRSFQHSACYSCGFLLVYTHRPVMAYADGHSKEQRESLQERFQQELASVLHSGMKTHLHSNVYHLINTQRTYPYPGLPVAFHLDSGLMTNSPYWERRA